MLCLDDTKVMQPEVRGKHIALVTPPHPDGGVLFTEPLIISVRLGVMATRQLLLLLDSCTNAPFLYDPGKYLAPGLSVSAPLHNRSADGVERAFAVLPPQDMQIIWASIPDGEIYGGNPTMLRDLRTFASEEREDRSK